MNFFHNLKITHYLIIVMAAALISFILIGLTYNSILSFERESAQRITEIEKNSILLEETQIAYLQSRILEEKFFATYDGTLLQKYSSTLKTSYYNIETLINNVHLEQESDDLNLLSSNIKKYEKIFNKATTLVKSIGLVDENSGRIGKLRKSVHNAEKIIRKIGNDRLLASMLQMRRHEKDFLVRHKVKYLTRFNKENDNFLKNLKLSKSNSTSKKAIRDNIIGYKLIFSNIANDITKLNQLREVIDSKVELVEPVFAKVLDNNGDYKELILSQEKTTSRNISYVFITVIVFGAVLLGFMLFSLSRKLLKSLSVITNTITRYSEGDNDIRNNLKSSDELGELSRTFDSMLDERVALQEKLEIENELLNDSIIELLESTSKVSDKDLTIKLKVSEDVTGPLSDAINQVVEETASVLNNIQLVANKVQNASETVNEQGHKVSEMAKHEREIIIDAVHNLESSAISMKQMTELAQSCNKIAAQTSSFTDDALKTVTETATGMNDIRETISETEKRIKRLGERSQEITAVVDIINTIAERTHVLALNASMQAAAAGEAGRGFSVVADEVQRLAESSRDSTSRIASLVKSIQTETAETMSVMNKTIDKVVSGSKLAEKAGKEMIDTQKNTVDLTKAVSQIAEQSEKQMEVSNEIMNKAISIKEYTESTNVELEEQAKYTDNLTEFSNDLIKSVSIFKLPAA
ncbi:MAG: methyl-accepting chemotaxis protein [Gammaproteobacteria bacterium]